MSISLNKSLLSLFKCIIFTEKKINDLRNSIISYNNVNIIIYNIFKKDKINSHDFMLFLNSKTYNNNYINNFSIDEIKTMIKFNSKKLFHSNEEPFLNFNEIYKLFTGNYNINNNNELNWFRNYNNLINNSENYNEHIDYVDYEIKFSMFKILENEIDFTNNLKYLINIIKNKNDFDLIYLFNLLCDKKLKNIINENSLYEFFIKNYEKNFITKDEMKFIINKIDFDNKNYLNYIDFKKFFNIDYNNNNNNNLNNINKNIFNLNQNKNEIIQKFFYYIKQLFDYENYIEQLKNNLINQHLDFSIEKFYEFLSLDKNFDINNLFKITIPFKQLKLNFSKLKIYFSNDFELFFLLNRTNIYIYNSPITFNVIYKLLMPSFYQLIPEHICLNKIEISKDTLIDIKNLINIMIKCEVSMNNFKKFFDENSPDIIFKDIINYNYNNDNNNNNNNKVSYITYYTFFNYVKCNNIFNVDDDNIKNTLEIIFNRINKSNNGKLSLFDLNKELNYI